MKNVKTWLAILIALLIGGLLGCNSLPKDEETFDALVKRSVSIGSNLEAAEAVLRKIGLNDITIEDPELRNPNAKGNPYLWGRREGLVFYYGIPVCDRRWSAIVQYDDNLVTEVQTAIGLTCL